MGLFKKKNTDMEEDLIPVASEAYKQAYKKNKNLEFQHVSFIIADAVRKGAYSLKDSGTLNENTVRILRDKGYDVFLEYNNQKTYTISWGKPDESPVS